VFGKWFAQYLGGFFGGASTVVPANPGVAAAFTLAKRNATLTIAKRSAAFTIAERDAAFELAGYDG